MSALAVCSAEIDWSTTGAWFSGFATFAGVIVACVAMRTWKEQIRLQDRFQKADALLRSFILCIRAGHDWQWDCGVGKNRDVTCESEKSRAWRAALMDYRLDWQLSQSLFAGDQINKLTVHPENVQSEIIGAGCHLSGLPDETLLFFKQLEKLMADGVSEIIARKDVK